jgi:hypothetical protein
VCRTDAPQWLPSRSVDGKRDVASHCLTCPLSDRQTSSCDGWSRRGNSARINVTNNPAVVFSWFDRLSGTAIPARVVDLDKGAVVDPVTWTRGT